MSIAQRHWEEIEGRGWSDPQTNVCQRCIADTYLRRLIKGHLTGTVCTYCNRKSRRSAPLSLVMDAVLRGVKYSYNDEANAGCPYDKEMSIKYMLSSNVLEAVLGSEGLEWPEQLKSDVANAFVNEDWVDAPDGDWMGSYDHERLQWSWDSFAHAVKHQSRFHFQTRKRQRSYSDDLVSVHEMLPFLGSLVRRHRIVRTVSEFSIFYRVRLGNQPNEASELGPPPKGKTTAGRMNPAGIPYFYLAFDEKTALAETRTSPGDEATISQWITSRDLSVIDLSHRLSCPSIFEDKKREHDMVQFLWKFVGEISKPIAHDGSEHIEYVPTQVVSEYFAQTFRYGKGKPIDGLIYPSAMQSGGKNLVIFPANGGHPSSRSVERFQCVTLKSSTTTLGSAVALGPGFECRRE